MKTCRSLGRLVVAIVATTLVIASYASAQTNGIAAKSGGDLIAIKTDPVLRNPIDMIGVKTDPVLSDPKGMIAVKTDPVLNQIDGLSLNFDSLMDLLAELQKGGSKISYHLTEFGGMTLLEVSLNGKQMTPFVVDCEKCGKIVFEY